MNNKKHAILIAESHELLRAGLRALLGKQEDLALVGECDDCRQVDARSAALRPHVVVMDIGAPPGAGLEAIARLRQASATTRVLVLTGDKSDDSIRAALRAGVMGYVLKSATQAELLAAIRSVAEGRVYLSPAISERVISSYLGMDGDGSWNRLTKREREVLSLVARGSGNRHIAAALKLSIKTVEKHRSNLMRKLGMRNASMLTAYAIERGLVRLES